MRRERGVSLLCVVVSVHMMVRVTEEGVREVSWHCAHALETLE